MSSRTPRQAGLTLIETLVAITIFSIMTVGLVPLLGAAMSGGAATRTESVARNLTSKTLERLRGLQYHVAYSSTPRKADLLDHFFPSQTPAYVSSVGTGYDAATQSYVTTCDSTSSSAACNALPSRSEIPKGFLVEVRATFRTPSNPAVTQSVPVGYAWNASGGADAPPSELLEVKITTAWSVGTRARTFELRSYLGARARSGVSAGPGGGGSATPPPGGSGPPPPPTSVKLRAEARIDYGYETTTTYQDNSTPPRLQEYTGTLGTAVAYGEQLDSGSKAELSVRAGRLQITRAPDPAVSGDTGLEIIANGAAFDAVAPPDAGTTATTTAAEAYAMNSETPISGGAGYLAASEAGTLSGSRGAGPTVAGGLPFVKGYYDLNGSAAVSPSLGQPTHFWLMPQRAFTTSGTETTTNPLNHTTTTAKTVTVNDFGGNAVDPRGEVAIDATATTPASLRAVTASATIPSHGTILIFPSSYTASGAAYLRISQFDASVSCAARADASAASTATGSWSALLEYYSFEGTSNKDDGYQLRRTTLPTQTRTDNPHVPQGNTNPLQAIKSLNNGNGPKIWDVNGAFGDSVYDVYLFAGNGKRGLLTGWSQAGIETSISSDDRVAEARLNGAIRMESSPVHGPWPNPSTGQVSQKPQSDFTFSMGKLSCRAEDYR
ncbi:MAG TPA: prepilin-type N-terminal cleavage/methylation domain-containing protein [Actinomycetota bacterium]|nr:prepilin-type N-terminal cleavage/methylation domain-containing protein [Actinomycetota bacterium]